MKDALLAPRSDAWSFIVNRERFEDCNVERSVAPRVEDVPVGSALIEVDRFSLTTNNIFYALSGDEYHYWDLFPAKAGYGIVPVWGVGDVIASRHPEIATGERLYGLFPMATHLLVQVAEVTARSFRDAAPHRQGAAAPYSNYFRRLDLAMAQKAAAFNERLWDWNDDDLAHLAAPTCPTCPGGSWWRSPRRSPGPAWSGRISR
jgi:Protein of unknown function (DUF2855)